MRLNKGAFAYCRKFKQVYIPKTVKEIEDEAFMGNPKLQIFSEFESYPSGWSKNIKNSDNEIIWNTKA